MSLTLILQTIGNNNLSILADQNKKNQDVPDGAGDASDDRVSRNIKNLSTIAKSAKSKKPKLTKPKKLNLIKAQNFAKTSFSKTDFFTFKAKKSFIYLQKTFIKASILRNSIQNVLFKLRLILWSMLLVGF